MSVGRELENLGVSKIERLLCWWIKLREGEACQTKTPHTTIACRIWNANINISTGGFATSTRKQTSPRIPQRSGYCFRYDDNTIMGANSVPENLRGLYPTTRELSFRRQRTMSREASGAGSHVSDLGTDIRLLLVCVARPVLATAHEARGSHEIGKQPLGRQDRVPVARRVARRGCLLVSAFTAWSRNFGG